jgi:hypothetical protein
VERVANALFELHEQNNCAAGGRVLAHSDYLDTSNLRDVPSTFDESPRVEENRKSPS